MLVFIKSYNTMSFLTGATMACTPKFKGFLESKIPISYYYYRISEAFGVINIKILFNAPFHG